MAEFEDEFTEQTLEPTEPTQKESPEPATDPVEEVPSAPIDNGIAPDDPHGFKQQGLGDLSKLHKF